MSYTLTSMGGIVQSMGLTHWFRPQSRLEVDREGCLEARGEKQTWSYY